MELLLQAIEEKLASVDSERKRWLQYQEEHVQAGNNLREFPKSFHKEILVPIGSKALMPGHLYHTNEIFVGMYSGLFVKCSAEKALTVCEHRLNQAAKRIDELNVEHKMYRDRLELPTENQLFGNGSEAREIIEEYNEEEEQQWREKHKISMREHKQAEAEARKCQQQTDDIDIDAILEQAELMEELENELEQLNVEDDAHLQEYFQGNSFERRSNNDTQNAERNQNDENDVQNDEASTDEDEDDNESDEIESEEFLALSAAAASLSDADKIKFYEIHLLKVREYFEKNQRSLHNFNEFADKRVTEECLQNAIGELQESLNNNTTETGHKVSNTNQTEHNENPCKSLCTEIDCHNGMEPRKFHTSADFDEIEREYSAQQKSKSELLIFYKSQLRNVMKSIAGCTIDMHAREEKRKLYEFLSDRISSLRDEIQKEKQIKLEEEFVDDDDIEKSANVKHLDRNFGSNDGTLAEIDDFKDDEPTNKRKISFASQPVTVTFYEDDEPCVVSQESMNNLIDTTFQFFNSPSSSSASSVCGDDDDTTHIADEHLVNNANDCDINYPMNNFIENKTNEMQEHTSEPNEDNNHLPSQPKPNTLVLQFDHSSNPCTATISEDDDIINSPLDIYRRFGANTDMLSPSRSVGFPSHENHQQSPFSVPQTQNYTKNNTVEMTNEANDTLSLARKMLEVPNIDAKPQKSILKNTNAVKSETRAATITDDNEDPHFTTEPSEDFPKFTQVLGEIVEHNAVKESQSLLVGNVIQPERPQSGNDGDQPKKRISLFKMSRTS